MSRPYSAARLRVRMLLVALLFLGPIFLLGHHIQTSAQASVSEVEQRVQPLAYEKALFNLLSDSTHYQVAILKRIVGVADAEKASQAISDQIETDFSEVKAATSDELSSTEPLYEAWQHIKSSSNYVAADYAQLRTDIVQRLQQTALHAGQLTYTDPDSAALTELLLRKLPQTLDATANDLAKTVMLLHVNHGVLPEAERAPVLAFANTLRTAYVRAVHEAITTAQQTNVEPKDEAQAVPMELVITDYETSADTLANNIDVIGRGDTLSPDTYAEIASTFYSNTHQLGVAGFDTLEASLKQQLAEREDGFSDLFLLCAACVFVALALAFFGLPKTAEQSLASEPTHDLTPMIADVVSTIEKLRVQLDDTAAPLTASKEQVQAVSAAFAETSFATAGAVPTNTTAAREQLMTLAEHLDVLALNSIIESSRAGESGKGFTALAADLKALSKQVLQVKEVPTSKTETTDQHQAALNALAKTIALLTKNTEDAASSLDDVKKEATQLNEQATRLITAARKG